MGVVRHIGVAIFLSGVAGGPQSRIELNPVSVARSIYEYSGPPTTATSLLRPLFFFFWPHGKTTIHFLVKRNTSLIRSPVNTAKFFWPLGDRIIGVPLYMYYYSSMDGGASPSRGPGDSR